MLFKQFILGTTLLFVLKGVIFANGQKAREEPVFNSLSDLSQPKLTDEQQQRFSDHVMEGFTAEGKDDYAAALDSYGKALAINKDSATAWIRHAYAAAKLGKYDVTARDLKSGASSTPVSVTDYLTLAWFRATSPFAEMRDGARAVAYALKALREQESADAYDMLAAGYAEMGNYGRAQENIRTAIKLYPDSGRSQMLRDHLELYKNRKPWRTAWGQDQKQMDQAVRNAAN
jgi:tetratricopeptide (TPR) repeat protein